jgi:exosome complex component RRP41
LEAEYLISLSFSRGAEIALIIKQTFETVVLTTLAPRSQIDIYINVLQSDGGIKSAAINAATLALIDAGVPMTDFVCSCAAGFIDGTTILGIFI